MDRLDASAGLTFLKNGAKETRTPDPLHAMQVLYQLSYGPKTELRHDAFVSSNRSLQRQRPWPTLTTSVAIRRPACLGLALDPQAAQSGHKQGWLLRGEP